MDFVDRNKELTRLKRALERKEPQFIVIYGRRRIGKSTIIKKILKPNRGDVYFLADRTSEPNQRQLFAESVAMNIEGFNSANYPNWEAILMSLNRQIDRRIVVCLDEFPYLVKSCPALPSILQKLLDSKNLKFDLIICGSSQQMMQGFILDSKEPLYGRAEEIMKLNPIPPSFIRQALNCDAKQAVMEYSIWGGVPRYWELRNNYHNLYEAIENLFFAPDGILYDEPLRLLRDEMRDTVQASSLLAFIAFGAHKISEISTRAEKKSTDITPHLARLKELGFIKKELPFGENEKNSKKGLYYISDPVLRFHYRFVSPYRSLLELENYKAVMNMFEENQNEYVSGMWEELCRNFVSANGIDGIMYNMASRWWGNYFDEDNKLYMPAELDVVAESFDGKHLFLGECKWQENVNPEKEMKRLKNIVKRLPFAENREVHYALFLKNTVNHESIRIFTPEDVLFL